MRDLSVVAALLSTNDVIIALAAFATAMAVLTKTVFIPFGKTCRAAYLAYKAILVLQADMTALRTSVGKNGKETLFELAHGLNDKVDELEIRMGKQDRELKAQSVVLDHLMKASES